MQIVSAADLNARKCVPCEGGVAACSIDHAKNQLHALPHWSLSEDGKWIARTLRFANFVQAVECINVLCEIAEADQHHPDLHLTGYRNLTIQLSTHAIGGLSENDFILAAKCDSAIAERFPKAQ